MVNHMQRDLSDVAIAVLAERRKGSGITLRSARGNLIKLLVIGWGLRPRRLGSHGPPINPTLNMILP
jgi:hypothetical protein